MEGPVASDVQPRRRGRPSLVRKAEELMRRERLFPTASRALVMVSGGQDSLALLHLLGSGTARQTGPRSLHVLHVNHHLRGPESDADEALVVQACARMAVGLTVVHRPVDKRRGNVQEAARDARREAALEVAGRTACDRIALGHTADDQVETMLYRLGRYGGLAALAGMKPCDPPWVRPLLGCRREETAAYCREQGLQFAVDRGNAYPGYARTGIRESVLPIWEAVLPGAVDAACRTAEVAAELQELAAAVVAEAGPGVARALEMSASALLGLKPAVRRLLLHQWLEARARPAASRASVLAVEALLDVAGSAERALGGGWRATKEYDRVYLTHGPRQRPAPAGPVPLPVPGRVEWGEAMVVAEPAERFRAPDVSCEAFLDADSINGCLVVRGPQPGDRLRPLGASGTRKLQDVLVDLRVPAEERARRPLVVCDERIVWVCGLVLAEEARITRETTRFLRLSVGPRQGGEAAPCGSVAKGEQVCGSS